jgi:hypothetical protein
MTCSWVEPDRLERNAILFPSGDQTGDESTTRHRSAGEAAGHRVDHPQVALVLVRVMSAWPRENSTVPSGDMAGFDTDSMSCALSGIWSLRRRAGTHATAAMTNDATDRRLNI